jgi:hypothetical protein
MNLLFKTWIIISSTVKPEVGNMPNVGIPYLMDITNSQIIFHYLYKDEPEVYQVTVKENKIMLDDDNYLTVTKLTDSELVLENKICNYVCRFIENNGQVLKNALTVFVKDRNFIFDGNSIKFSEETVDAGESSTRFKKYYTNKTFTGGYKTVTANKYCFLALSDQFYLKTNLYLVRNISQAEITMLDVTTLEPKKLVIAKSAHTLCYLIV